MKRAAPVLLVAAALAAAFGVSRGGRSRESVLPLSRAVADHEKALDRGAALVFPLSADEERKAGEEMDKGMRPPPAAPGTPQASRAALWKELGQTACASAVVKRFPKRCEFRVVDYSGKNAFSLPGAFYYATDELLKELAKDPDAVLFVLGHELGHVELGHTADGYRLTAKDMDPVRTVLGGVASVARVFASLHFSQSQELEADAYAVRLLRSLKRDPAAGLRAFDTLGLKAETETKRDPGRVAVEGLSDYFSTHPGSWERRNALQREIERTR